INNKNTNYTTDHIFNGLNAGQYIVEIKKEGFKVLNNNQTITINNANQSNALYFNLEQNSATVKIRTEGQKGIIYLDSKQVGIETFEKNLNFGNYTVSFNEIDNYITPRAINLSIYETKNYNYSVTYIPIIRYEANIISNSFKSSDFTFRFGYAQFGRFVEDKEHGPKFVTDKNGKSVLEFSFPFEYNNPKGGHALKFNFSLPRTFYNSQHIVLKLAVFYTDENYSLIGQGDPRITLIVNNHRQLNNIKLTNKRETTQGYPTQDFVINSYLRTGDNEIILYLPDANTSFIQLQHIYLGQ
ncbi:MAG: hypothetical protein KDD94_08080, partial [Calditrichaeota bacterium]|nr:hypothetical protein [Calditrichota bacterium]